MADATQTIVGPGSQLGPYKLEATLGAGGMGQVFRATDSRLGRAVAVKISQEKFSDRFEREARAIAALNHPNICTLHDVGPNYLVMELVEGETLAARLNKGKLSIEQTIQYGFQIADALAAAHAKGVTHRDLKPANIMVTKAGVKVLDFGLAKSAHDDALTATNAVVGTPAYMAPEQLEGKDCDARTDIYALGLVLYEMATGRRPPAERTPVEPAALNRLINACLAVDPDERMQDVRDLKTALTLVSDLHPIFQPRHASRLPLIVAAAATLIAMISGVLYFRDNPPAQRSLRYTISGPENATSIHSFAISPDGRYVAIAAEVKGRRQLWLRALDTSEARPLATTEDAISPFWSPDSRYIGFFTQNKLKKIAAEASGPAEVVCDAGNGSGGTWNRDNLIVFAMGGGTGPIRKVPAAGGVPTEVTKTKGRALFPVFLPDGGRFLYVVVDLTPEQNGVYVSSLDGKDFHRILPDQSSVALAAGRLLFIRENTLMAQPFDAGGARVSGEAFPVAKGVFLATVGTSTNIYAPVSVSETGVLLYAVLAATRFNSQLEWHDRSGKLVETVGPEGRVAAPALSPDGSFVVYRRETATGDLWKRDLTRGTEQRLTDASSTNIQPAWSPDGASITFSSTRGGHFDLYRKGANGSGPDELLIAREMCELSNQWSRDGRFLIYEEACGSQKGWEIWLLDMESGADRKPGSRQRTPFLRGDFGAWLGQLSPDGRWMAYASDESGQTEVYVRPFPSGEDRQQVSFEGGDQPRWRGDGKELFFVAADGKMMAVAMRSGAGTQPSLESGVPQRLLKLGSSP